jgi:cell division protein FtsB
MNFFRKIKEGIEKIIPMTLGNFVIFLVVLYMFFVVGRSIWVNYNSNKSLEDEVAKIELLRDNITELENQIAYYQTQSFREKEARAKLGYRAPGENIMILPLDTEEEKVADVGLGEVSIKTPNYVLWWKYFFER